ncbi:MAG: hypothetical protein R2713_11885 [Ilumatobacteraceae bacterium]
MLTCLLAEGHALLEASRTRQGPTAEDALSDAVDLSFAGAVHARPDARRRRGLGARRRTSTVDGRSGSVPARCSPGSHMLADEINRATPKTQSALLEGDAGAVGHRRRATRALPRRSW